MPRPETERAASPAGTPIEVTAGDGFRIAATLHAGSAGYGTVVIAGAVGVTQPRYTELAAYLAGSGWTVITFDYRGLGLSKATAEVFAKASMQEWARLDLEAVLHWARTSIPGERRTAIGHSIGGQLLGLTDEHVHLDAAVMIAVQKGYWALWPGFLRYGIFGFFRFAVPTALACIGKLPLRLVGLQDLPPGAAADWARWGLHDEFFDASFESQKARFAKVRVPMLAVSIEDDRTYAPRPTVDWLYESYYRCAPRVRCHIEPSTFGLAKVGHSGFFSASVAPQVWWDEISAWMRSAEPAAMTAGLSGNGPCSLRRAIVSTSAPQERYIEEVARHA